MYTIPRLFQALSVSGGHEDDGASKVSEKKKKRGDDTDQTIRLGNSSSSTNYPNSSPGRIIRLLARIYTQKNYQMNYRYLPN